MDKMINSELIKELRKQKAWSQEQLATVANLSLRTVQRIENEGTCSLESLKSLASVFETSTNVLEIDPATIVAAEANRKGLRWGYIGAGVGVVAASVAVIADLMFGGSSWAQAGLTMGVMGLVIGLFCSFIGMQSRRRANKNKLKS